MSDADILQRPSTTDPTLDGDHERLAHIILESAKFEGKDEPTQVANVTAAYIEGTPVRALCGKVWVPSRDPKRYPVCPECKEIAASMGWNLPG